MKNTLYGNVKNICNHLNTNGIFNPIIVIKNDVLLVDTCTGIKRKYSCKTCFKVLSPINEVDIETEIKHNALKTMI